MPCFFVMLFRGLKVRNAILIVASVCLDSCVPVGTFLSIFLDSLSTILNCFPYPLVISCHDGAQNRVPASGVWLPNNVACSLKLTGNKCGPNADIGLLLLVDLEVYQWDFPSLCNIWNK